MNYTDKKDALHLLNVLKTQYVISEDWEAKLYCGVTLKWDYSKRTCNLSIPNYVTDALKSFQHNTPSRPQNEPHPWVKKTYGQTVQLTEVEDSSALLYADGVNLIQRIIEKCYYYARAVDHTMLVALGALSTKTTLGIASQNVMEDVVHLLNYAATHPDASIQYHASGTVLHVDSDASYLSVRK